MKEMGIDLEQYPNPGDEGVLDDETYRAMIDNDKS